ncbi:MAG TPA: hypothetical protein VMT67_17480 [Terriglobales bacterium]|nr:hypothetical protein [Terriglobales bacterium]
MTTQFRLALCIILQFYIVQSAPAQDSRVEGHTFISPDNPKLQITIDEKFNYLGSLPFAIGNAAAGYRFIFVDAGADKRVQRMFVIQQEGFLPSSNDTYKYPIVDPVRLGTSEYRHSVSIVDDDEEVRQSPGAEAGLTRRFLESRGYKLNAALVMSRFARPSDPARKHEIILFCFEDLARYGHAIADFLENSQSAEKQRVKKVVDENCGKTFRITD